MPQTIPLDELKIQPEVQGNVISINDIKPDSISPSIVPLADFKVKETWTAEDEIRAKKYGRLYAEPKRAWYKHVLDFGKELVPFRYMMSAQGRELFRSLPEPAQANKRFLEFTKALDWTIGGDAGIAFLGRQTLKKTGKNASTDIMETLLKEKKTMPLLYPKKHFGIKQPIRTVEEIAKESGIDTISNSTAKSITSTEREILKRKTGIKESIANMRNERPLKMLKQAEDELAQKKVYDVSKIGSLLSKPKSQLGQTYQPKAMDKMLEGVDATYLYSGIPVDKAWRDIVHLTKQGIDKIYWKPTTPKDMNWWHQTVSLPHWLVKKFPKAKRFYDIERLRGDSRSELSHKLLEGVDDFFKLKGDDYETARKLLVLGDKENKIFTSAELLKAGANEKVVTAYNKVRGTLDAIQSDYWSRMKEAGIPADEIQKYRQQMGNIMGYFPRMREGKYFIRAVKEGEAPIRKHFNTGFAGKKITKELEEQGYKITESGKITKLPEEAYFQISPNSIGAAFESATQGWDEVTRKALKRNLSDVFKDRGFMRHGISRQEFIKGYETENLKNVLYNYVNGYSGFVTKMEAGKKFSKELMDLGFSTAEDIGARKTPDLYQWASKYVKDMMTNADAFDQVSGKLRAAFFYKYLGGVIKSGTVNLTQNFIAAAPRLSLDTKFAYAKITKGMADIVRHYNPKQGYKLAADETKALRVALQKGWSQDQYTKELMGHISQYGTISNKVQNVLGAPMGIAEKFNRQSTMLAAYRVFKDKAAKKGLGGEEAFDWAVRKAGDVVEDSHFVYGKSNLPGAFRGTKAGKLARTGYTFRTFTHNYLNLMSHIAKKDKGAVAKSLASIGIIGGVSSIPFFKTVEGVASRFGYNPRSYIKGKLEEYGLDGMSDVALYGLPSLLGVDLGGSIGIEVPGQQNFSHESISQATLEAAVDVLGVPASMFEDTYSSAQQLYYGDYYRAIEASPATPMVVGNAMKAHRLKTEGVTSRTGMPIREEGEPFEKVKLTTGETIKKGVFGFQPTRMTENFRKFQARRAEEVRWTKEKTVLKARFTKQAIKHGLGSAEIDKVWDQINKFNVKKPLYVSDIDPSDWIESIMGKGQTEKQMLIEQQIR